METLAKVVELLKLPARIIWALTLAAGFVLFLPESVLTRLHVLKFAQDHGTQIGPIFMVSLLLLVIDGVVRLWMGIGRRIAQGRRHDRAIASLSSLDRFEMAVLREFFLQGRNTIQVPVDHATVVGLLNKGILDTVGERGERSTAGILFPVTIPPVVRERISGDLIDLPSLPLSEEDKEALLRSRPEFVGEIEEHNDVMHTSWRGRRRAGRD